MTSLSTPCPASSGPAPGPVIVTCPTGLASNTRSGRGVPFRDEDGGAGHREPDPAVLATDGPGLAEHVGDGGGGGGPRPGDGDRWFVLTVEGVAVVPQHEQRPAYRPVDLEHVERRPVAGLGAGHGPCARELAGEEGEGVRGGVAAAETAALVAQQRELADHQVHHLEVIDGPRDIRVRGSSTRSGGRRRPGPA